MSNDEAVLVEARGAVQVITINRPDSRNAVNQAVRQGIRAAVDDLEASPVLRVGVLTGAGATAFCAGMDLKESRSGSTSRLGGAHGGFAGFARYPRTKPVIAAVNGAALGGGFELVLACELVVAHRDAWFALPEPTRGIIAGGGGAIRLPQRLPRAVAHEILLAGGRLTAEAAAGWGLVNRVVDADVVGAAIDYANAICRGAPLAIAGTLAIAQTAGKGMEAVAWDVSDAQVGLVRMSADRLEGSAAFLEKREPEWTGA